MGFSKGSLVLNHLLAELATASLLFQSENNFSSVPHVIDWEAEGISSNFSRYFLKNEEEFFQEKFLIK